MKRVAEAARKTRRAISLSDKAWWLVIFAGALYLALAATPFDRVWLNPGTVVVEGGPDAYAARVAAYRTIHRDFSGGYWVEVREFPSNRFVCRVEDPVSYQADASTPALHKPLRWWLGGPAKLEHCIERGLRDGQFYIKTGYWISRPYLGIFPRLESKPVLSNVFAVGAATAVTITDPTAIEGTDPQ